MSYDIDLCDPVTRGVLQLDAAHHMRGGTFCVGGTTNATLKVTYNYTRFFGNVGNNGIRSICGKTGAESIPMLTAAINSLGDDVDPDYWKPTAGNAKKALIQLRTLAQMRPDGVWSIDGHWTNV